MGSAAGFAAFVADHQVQLGRLGWALTGDAQLGEDLVQAALTRLWRRWEAVSRSGDPGAYLHRIMINLWSSWRGRRFRSAEFVVADPPMTAPGTRWDDQASDRVDVDRWLNSVPPRQRAALVLRFLLDLSVEETAARLGCSPGTVKSQTSKGLQAMRAAMSSDNQVQP